MGGHQRHNPMWRHISPCIPFQGGRGVEGKIGDDLKFKERQYKERWKEKRAAAAL